MCRFTTTGNRPIESQTVQFCNHSVCECVCFPLRHGSQDVHGSFHIHSVLYIQGRMGGGCTRILGTI